MLCSAVPGGSQAQFPCATHACPQALCSKTLVHEDLWNVAAEDSAQAVSEGFQWNLSSAQVGGAVDWVDGAAALGEATGLLSLAA